MLMISETVPISVLLFVSYFANLLVSDQGTALGAHV